MGLESLDPFVEEAYKILSKHGTRHANGIITNNCKTEADRLIKLAKALQAMGGAQ